MLAARQTPGLLSAQRPAPCATGARPLARLALCRAQPQQQPLQQPLQPELAQQQPSLVARVEAAVLPTFASLMVALPASAAEEPGRLFDFNLTLPAMMGQFLLLLVMLDKLWFTPVGKVLDERDALIRSKLAGVKGNTGDVDKFAAEAQEILRAARQEVTAMIGQQKSAKQAELDAQYAAAKSKITSEVEASIAVVEKESQAMLAKLDEQVDKISGEVLRRVLPDGVKI